MQNMIISSKTVFTTNRATEILQNAIYWQNINILTHKGQCTEGRNAVTKCTSLHPFPSSLLPMIDSDFQRVGIFSGQENLST